MTYGRIYNGIKYMGLFHNNDLKKLSLNDNVYFTLRDIFANADSYDICIAANHFNSLLTNNISFEERNSDEPFQYSNVLEQKEFVKRLQTWLSNFDVYWFHFLEEDGDEEDGDDDTLSVDMNDYIKWEDWWIQLEELKRMLKEQLNE
jgi:hypothetical protein